METQVQIANRLPRFWKVSASGITETVGINRDLNMLAFLSHYCQLTLHKVSKHSFFIIVEQSRVDCADDPGATS
jgi:hypothetical protein